MKQLSYSPATTVQKAFLLLEQVGKNQPARPADLARELEFTRSNVYRLLATLEDLGYVEKTPEAKVRLTLKLYLLGNAALQGSSLPEVAHPDMLRLSALCRENVNLAVLYQKRVLYIGKIESPHRLKFDRPVGETDPAHCTALGKVLLAGQNDPEVEAFCKTAKLRAYTRKTIVQGELLRTAIRQVQRLGYATDFEELNEGIHCLAAPIYDHRRMVAAALSISGPAMRLTKARIEELKKPLLETALRISCKLGYTRSGGRSS